MATLPPMLGANPTASPTISAYTGLDPEFLGGPAASGSRINSLLWGSSFQLVPINITSFYSGIPPIFGGQGYTGTQTIPYNFFPQPFSSPYSGGAAFGNGYGTFPFGIGVTGGQQANPFASMLSGYGAQTSNPYAAYGGSIYGGSNPYAQVSNPYAAFGGSIYGSNPYALSGYGQQATNPFASALYGMGSYGVQQNPFVFNGYY